VITINQKPLHVQRCWDFSQDEKPPYPTIDLLLARSKDESVVRVAFKVDTGFSGTVSLSDKVVDEMGLETYGNTVIATATDTVEVPLYRVLLTQEELRMSGKQVAALGTKRCLVGRMLLRNECWLLNFVHNKFCLLESDLRKQSLNGAGTASDLT